MRTRSSDAAPLLIRLDQLEVYQIGPPQLSPGTLAQGVGGGMGNIWDAVGCTLEV